MLRTPVSRAFALAAILWLIPAGQAATLLAQAGEGEETSLDQGNAATAADEAALRARMAVIPGSPFPSSRVTALQPGSLSPAPLDLGAVLGRKPLVLFYLKIGHGLSEELYLEVQDFIDSSLEDRVVLHPVALLGRRFEVSELRERMQLLGITRRMILDEDRRLQLALNMRHAPHLALVHSDGNLAFSGARSLGHPVFGEMDAAGAITVSASGERPPSRELWRYYPANDLKGKVFPDVSLTAYDSGKRMKISDFVEPGKLTAVFYWSPGCRYSRSVMPGLAIGQKTLSPKYLNVVTVVRDGRRDEIAAVAREAGLTAPILTNRQKRFTTKYRVMSTPTLILIRPDGIIDGVYTSGKINLYPVLSTRVKKLIIDPAKASSPGPR